MCKTVMHKTHFQLLCRFFFFLQKEIRSSLVLSMLQQMLTEDKADMVREAVVKSLGIIMGYIDDSDKYAQVYNLPKKRKELPEIFDGFKGFFLNVLGFLSICCFVHCRGVS